MGYIVYLTNGRVITANNFSVGDYLIISNGSDRIIDLDEVINILSPSGLEVYRRIPVVSEFLEKLRVESDQVIKVEEPHFLEDTVEYRFKINRSKLY